MDPGSFRTFDLSYYSLLLKRRGLFQSDAALTTSPVTKAFVTDLLNGSVKNFFAEFGLAMEKMGRIGVKTGSEGEIRKHCALVNAWDWVMGFGIFIVCLSFDAGSQSSFRVTITTTSFINKNVIDLLVF